MKQAKTGFSAASPNYGRQGWRRGKFSKKLTSAIVTGLLFSYGHIMWTPTAFADNANITISTSSDYTSPTDPNATFISSGANAGTFYLAGSNNTLLIIPSTSGWVISDATTYPDSFGVMGGYSGVSNVTISGNTVTVGSTSNSNANIGKNVYGGYVTGSNSNANNNTVIIYNGTVSGAVQGGKSIQGNSDGNAATVYGGTIEQGVSGGYTQSTTGTANNNTVTITNGTVSGSYAVIGGAGATASGNNVTVSGGTVNGSHSGGVGVIGALISGSGDAANNNVTISGNSTISGFVGVAGVFIADGTATNNNITISGGTINASAGDLAAVIGVASGNGTVSENTTTIDGGTISGDVYAGYTMGTATITNNTITINPLHSLSLSGATLYGSNITHDYNTATSTQLGNTLNVYGKNITATNVANFSTINFYLPGTIVNGDTVLILTSGSGTDLSQSTIKAGVTGSANIHAGDTIILLTNSSGLTTTGTTYGTLTQGVSSQYGLTVSQAGNSVIATIASAPASSGSSTLLPQTKSLVETRTAGTAFLNKGMDLFSGQGIANAVAAAQSQSPQQPSGQDAKSGAPIAETAQMNQFTPFTVIGGSSMRYETGSYVDSRGYSLGLGVSRSLDNKQGKLTIGSLLEGGRGSYDSYLDSGVHGNGNSKYYGIGLLARQDRQDGLYYEGSLHYGRMSTDYSSTDLTGISHETYSLKVPYYAGHVGIGKIRNINDKHSVDLYGKYYYSYQAGKSAELASGETYDFDSVTSNRLRVGARYSNQYAPTKKTYIETAYEYELGGDATASYQGNNTLTPSLKGGSGMLGFGYQVTPGKTSPLTIDMSVNEWTGKQQGISGNVNLTWHL